MPFNKAKYAGCVIINNQNLVGWGLIQIYHKKKYPNLFFKVQKKESF